MYSKIYFLVGIAALFQVVLSDECSWSAEERKLNCCHDHEHQDLDKEIVEKCAKEFNLNPYEEDVDIYDACAEECVWREENNLDKDHKPSVENFMENAKSGKSDRKGEELKHWIKVLETCLKEKDTWIVKEGKCKSGANLAVHCMDTERYMGCVHWKDTAECNATREKITKCKDKLLMPPNAKNMTPK